MIAPILSLRQFYDQHYKPLKLRSRADNTQRLYEFSIRNFSRFLERESLLSDLTDENVSGLLAWMTQRGLSPYTANKERSQLLAMWRFACDKQFLKERPNVEAERQPKRIPRAWTEDELVRLFQACRETVGHIGDVPAALWWTGLHLVAWDTGERISAIRAIRKDWIDHERRVVRIPAEARKGNRSDEVYPLHLDTLAMIREIAEYTPGPWVFPWPFSGNLIYYRYAEIQRRADLPVGHKFRFHCMRKSVASHGAASGLDPQTLMRHRDGRVTAAYLDPTITGQKSVAGNLFRPDKAHRTPPRPQESFLRAFLRKLGLVS